MKLRTLLESSPSPRNSEGRFNVGNVTFDNEKGLGATPNNANVRYMGAVAWMTPGTFRKLAAYADRSDTAKELGQQLKDGKSIGCPFLQLEVEREGSEIKSVRVVGHEGRARADAVAAANGGEHTIPVHLFPVHLRARDLTQAFWDHVNTVGIIPERQSKPLNPKLTRAFLGDQELNFT